jgi:YidC/Oxa1 family membrane protein insertase
MSLADFVRGWKELRRFQSLPSEARSIVFYAEDAGSAVHFEPILKELTQNLGRQVCYLTSGPDDPILTAGDEMIRVFYVGSGVTRTRLFLALEADVLVMTMPDLETFHIKRSRVYPVHYVYVFHSMVSTHLVYRKGAFDHFDTVLCVGPHHIKEIRATEAGYGLKAKNLIEHGYGRLDALLQENSPRVKKAHACPHQKTRVLVAPSWGREGLLETRGCEIVKILLEAGYAVTVRPHPVTANKWPKAIKSLKDEFGDNPRFVLETDIGSGESLHNSDCLISDWSGVASEYAFAYERPVLFVDVPKKVNNPDFGDIDLEPLETAIRTQIGEVVSPDRLHIFPEKIKSLCENHHDFRERIRQVRSHTVFNIGKSGAVGAESIAGIADGCKRRIDRYRPSFS